MTTATPETAPADGARQDAAGQPADRDAGHQQAAEDDEGGPAGGEGDAVQRADRRRRFGDVAWVPASVATPANASIGDRDRAADLRDDPARHVDAEMRSREVATAVNTASGTAATTVKNALGVRGARVVLEEVEQGGVRRPGPDTGDQRAARRPRAR